MPLLLSFRFLTLLDFMHYRTGTTTILTSYISLHVTIKRLRTAFRSITPWTSRNFMSIGCHQKKFTYTGKTPLRNSTEESAPRWAFENQWVSCPLTSTTTTTKNQNFFHFNLGLQCFTRFRDLAFSISSLHEEERSFKFRKLWLLFFSWFDQRERRRWCFWYTIFQSCFDQLCALWTTFKKRWKMSRLGLVGSETFLDYFSSLYFMYDLVLARRKRDLVARYSSRA